MRPIVVFAALSACLTNAGCTAHTGRRGLEAQAPSPEITSSIKRQSAPSANGGLVTVGELLAREQAAAAQTAGSPEPMQPMALAMPSKSAFGAPFPILERRFRDAKPV